MDNPVQGLLALSNDTHAPAKIRKRAAALHQRLTTPLRVAFDGPDTKTVALLTQNMACDTELLHRTDQISDADLAVWCTQAFLPEEAAYWESVPIALQDNSLLVGPETDHIHSMGVAFFRQVCTPHTAGQKLLQRLEMGREADTDHAQALLEKHPPSLACDNPEPAQVKGDSILEYLQAQANQMAALKIEDTMESCEAVLSLCNETAHRLRDLVTSYSDTALQDAVYDATDAITLMMIEGDISAATEAVATLNQLKNTYFEVSLNTPVRQF